MPSRRLSPAALFAPRKEKAIQEAQCYNRGSEGLDSPAVPSCPVWVLGFTTEKSVGGGGGGRGGFRLKWLKVFYLEGRSGNHRRHVVGKAVEEAKRAQEERERAHQALFVKRWGQEILELGVSGLQCRLGV